jgi:hypothetical protein
MRLTNLNVEDQERCYLQWTTLSASSRWPPQSPPSSCSASHRRAPPATASPLTPPFQLATGVGVLGHRKFDFIN